MGVRDKIQRLEAEINKLGGLGRSLVAEDWAVPIILLTDILDEMTAPTTAAGSSNPGPNPGPILPKPAPQ